jgi:hypothetical protein
VNKFASGVMAGLLVAWAGTVAAAEMRGQIEAVDAEAKTITIDGTTYKIGEGVAATELVPGEDVAITYEEKDGENVITRVEPGQ